MSPGRSLIYSMGVSLELVEQRTFGSRVVYLRYRAAPTASRAS
ncbi:MAG TPA: hypothetical protein VK605_03745 [Solirubrobacteraceae bacterium]|nr:hypothetical protein [Solirubrobacteraceae bacterium]